MCELCARRCTGGVWPLWGITLLMLPSLDAVSLGRRIPAVQHGAGGHSLVPQHSVHPLRVLADLHQQLGAVNREERVRQLRAGDRGQILAEGEKLRESGSK